MHGENKSLVGWQTQMNKAIRGLRVKVEQAVGTMTRRFHSAPSTAGHGSAGQS